MLQRLYVLFHIHTVVYLAHCLELESSQHGDHGLWSQSGGVEKKVLGTWVQFIDPVLNNLVLEVISYPTVAHLLSTGLE